MSRYLVMSRLRISNYLYSLSSPFPIASKSRNFASQICPIFIDKSTKVICQGISEDSKKFLEYGTKMVGFVEKLREGETHLGLPVYNSVKQAKAEADPNASIITVPPEIAANSILEAVRAKLELVVCISEVLHHDRDKVNDALRESPTRLIGPNCPGIIKPRECKLGIMHDPVHKPGCIGIIARCGTVREEYSFLAFEQAVAQTSQAKLGQSTSVGIGRDPFVRTSLIDWVKHFLADPNTKGIIIIGETGKGPEEEAAEFVQKSGTSKPVIVYIAPPGLNVHHPLPMRAGHNRGIVSEGKACKNKMKKLKAYDAITVVGSSAKMTAKMRERLQGPVVSPAKVRVPKEKRWVVWEKPRFGEYKAISDGSVKFDDALGRKVVRVGGFIRNSDADYETGLHDIVEPPVGRGYGITPPEAEAYGMLYMAEHAISEGLLPLTIENDSKTVVKKIMQEEEPAKTLPVYQKLRKLVREHQIQAKYLPREITGIADKFADLDLGKRTVFNSLGEVHPDIQGDVREMIDFDKAGKAYLTTKQE